MAEPQEAPAAQDAGKKASFLGRLIVAACIVLAGAIAALSLYTFVLRPRLAAGDSDSAAATNPSPVDVVPLTFEDSYVTLIMPKPEMAASILQYQVSIDCSNEATRALVEKAMDRFVAKIRELHSYKKREEVDDPLVEESIRRQIQIEGNKIIQEMQAKPDPANRITGVYHRKFLVTDM